MPSDDRRVTRRSAAESDATSAADAVGRSDGFFVERGLGGDGRFELGLLRFRERKGGEDFSLRQASASLPRRGGTAPALR